MRAADWRLLLSPMSWSMKTAGLPFALDNGAWSAFQQGRPIDLDAFERAVECVGPAADWTVAPDIVAGGLRSLDLTEPWLHTLRHLRLVLIAVQDGMVPRDIQPLIRPGVDVFLGGSTEWKLATMQQWGEWAATLGVYFHVARVNSVRRIRMAHRAGAHSIDGSSVSRYAVTLPKLDTASRQHSLFSPRSYAVR
jgi:hypothetical protein